MQLRHICASALLRGKEEQLNIGSFYLSVTTKLLNGEIHTSGSTTSSCPCSNPARIRQVDPFAILQLQTGCSAIPPQIGNGIVLS